MAAPGWEIFNLGINCFPILESADARVLYTTVPGESWDLNKQLFCCAFPLAIAWMQARFILSECSLSEQAACRNDILDLSANRSSFSKCLWMGWNKTLIKRLLTVFPGIIFSFKWQQWSRIHNSVNHRKIILVSVTFKLLVHNPKEKKKFWVKIHCFISLVSWSLTYTIASISKHYHVKLYFLNHDKPAYLHNKSDFKIPSQGTFWDVCPIYRYFQYPLYLMLTGKKVTGA